jgi:hypothetical protein
MSQTKLRHEAQLPGWPPLASNWFIRQKQRCCMNSGLVFAALTLVLQKRERYACAESELLCTDFDISEMRKF